MGRIVIWSLGSREALFQVFIKDLIQDFEHFFHPFIIPLTFKCKKTRDLSLQSVSMPQLPVSNTI